MSENTCLKKGYNTYVLANEAMQSFNKMNKQGNVLKGVYHCGVCGKWHLTSMNPKDYKGKRKPK
jgi:hypothetical protein